MSAPLPNAGKKVIRGLEVAPSYSLVVDDSEDLCGWMMNVMRMLRRRSRWPKIEAYGPRSRSDIKQLSARELERLTAVASRNEQWSANGRPEWLQEHRDHIETLMLTIFGREGRGVYRCLVMAELRDKSKYRFTLDVSVDDFDRLPDLPLENVLAVGTHAAFAERCGCLLYRLPRRTWAAFRR